MKILCLKKMIISVYMRWRKKANTFALEGAKRLKKNNINMMITMTMTSHPRVMIIFLYLSGEVEV